MALISRFRVLALLGFLALVIALVVFNPLATNSQQDGSDKSVERLVDQSERLASKLMFTQSLARASITEAGVVKATHLLGIGIGLIVGFVGGAYLSLSLKRGQRS